MLSRPVVLIGMMGAGKTAVGGALAAQLGLRFQDSDVEIERAAARSIAEIFEHDGEAFFRAREREVIARLLSGAPGILSVGGGAWLSPQTRALISTRGVSVWLRADADLLWSRVRGKSTRPLLRTEDPRGTLERLSAERAPIYALSDLTVKARPDLSVEAMARIVAGALAAHGTLPT